MPEENRDIRVSEKLVSPPSPAPIILEKSLTPVSLERAVFTPIDSDTDQRKRTVLADDIAVLEKRLGKGGMSEVWYARLQNPIGLVKALVLRGEMSPAWLGIQVPFEEPKEHEMPKPITDANLIDRINASAEECRAKHLADPTKAWEEGKDIRELLGLKSAYVAVKVLKTLSDDIDPAKRAEHENRFNLEGFALRKLDHPGILRTYGLIHDKIGMCLYLEHIDGKTLEEYVVDFKDKQLPFDEAARIGIQIAEALRYAHSKGIIHRDMKPANVLMRKEENTPVIADFGLAKFFDASQTFQQTVVAGTPRYMAPEQWDGKVDERTDVYQLGILLFKIVTGHDRYEDKDQTDLLKAIKLSQEHPTSVRDYRKDISSAFEAIIEVSCAKNPDDRFTLNDVIDELGELISAKRYTEETKTVTSAKLSRQLKKLNWAQKVLASQKDYVETTERITEAQELFEKKEYVAALESLETLAGVFDLAPRYNKLKEQLFELELNLAGKCFNDGIYPAVGVILESAEKQLLKLPENKNADAQASYKKIAEDFSPFKMYVSDFNTKVKSVEAEITAVVNEYGRNKKPLEEDKRKELLAKLDYMATSVVQIPKDKIGIDHDNFCIYLKKIRKDIEKPAS